MEDCVTGYAYMEQIAPEFARAARMAGLPPKGRYTIPEVAKAIGTAKSTLYREAAAGRMATSAPRGRERGFLVKPEEAELYMKGGYRCI